MFTIEQAAEVVRAITRGSLEAVLANIKRAHDLFHAARVLVDGYDVAVGAPILIPRIQRADGTWRSAAAAVDFDGCLCTNMWPMIGEPNLPLIKALQEFRADRGELILWTCREGHTLEMAVEWCREHGLKFDAINDNLHSWRVNYGNNPRKVCADYYIDDKAIRVLARAGKKGAK